MLQNASQQNYNLSATGGDSTGATDDADQTTGGSTGGTDDATTTDG